MVERLFAGVTEGRMADVVDQGERLGQIRIQAQGRGHGARDLRHFKRVREAAAEVVSGGIAGQAGEDLRFAGQAAKGARVQNARAVPGKWSAVGMRRLGVRAKAKFTVPADGNFRRELSRRTGFQVHDVLWQIAGCRDLLRLGRADGAFLFCEFDAGAFQLFLHLGHVTGLHVGGR